MNKKLYANKLIFWLEASILIVSTCTICGCTESEVPMPVIVHDYQFNTPVHQTVHKDNYSYNDIPADWIPPKSLEKRWIAIVIHHSATPFGNAEIFDEWHRERNHWDGVGYDFVIGNGTDSADGQVEVTFRWKQQKTGAHVGGTYKNWANRDAIGICLVGNFNETLPSRKQMDALLKLVRFLQKRYAIPKQNIYGHNTTPGSRITDCPGKNFSIDKFKSML